MMRRFLALSAAAAAGCLTAALTVPASVGAPVPTEQVYFDPSGDQVFDGTGTPTNSGDFRRTSVRHGRHAVVVHSRFSDLDASDGLTLLVALFTNAHHRAENPQFWRLVDIVGEQVNLYQAGPVSHFSCERLRLDIDYTTNRFFLRLPRACLERPQWVRVQLSDSVGVDGPGDMDSTTWTDDALTSASSGGITPPLVRQPK